MNSPADRSGVQSLRGALNIEQIFTDLQTAYQFRVMRRTAIDAIPAGFV
jgi:hypothetical protein